MNKRNLESDRSVNVNSLTFTTLGDSKMTQSYKNQPKLTILGFNENNQEISHEVS